MEFHEAWANPSKKRAMILGHHVSIEIFNTSIWVLSGWRDATVESRGGGGPFFLFHCQDQIINDHNSRKNGSLIKFAKRSNPYYHLVHYLHHVKPNLRDGGTWVRILRHVHTSMEPQKLIYIHLAPNNGILSNKVIPNQQVIKPFHYMH